MVKIQDLEINYYRVGAMEPGFMACEIIHLPTKTKVASEEHDNLTDNRNNAYEKLIKKLKQRKEK